MKRLVQQVNLDSNFSFVFRTIHSAEGVCCLGLCSCSPGDEPILSPSHRTQGPRVPQPLSPVIHGLDLEQSLATELTLIQSKMDITLPGALQGLYCYPYPPYQYPRRARSHQSTQAPKIPPPYQFPSLQHGVRDLVGTISIAPEVPPSLPHLQQQPEADAPGRAVRRG